ncbi:MAG: FAD-binding protein [Bacteroidales bacterium]|nr:FAD-binding protein [Bacteroidales bacterium]
MVHDAKLINNGIGESLQKELDLLQSIIDGDIFTDLSTRLMYATDASAYREIPLAVCRPSDESDVIQLVKFSANNNVTLIPRAAGTSLAGQVVGGGMVVDISRYMTRTLQLDQEERRVSVQPGVILDELNNDLRSSGLFFSPETSTSNRCMIGGMIGNNSSGLRSLVYGSTREHIISVRMVLADGSIAEFGELTGEEFREKCALQNFEGELYRHINMVLSNEENIASIEAEFPDSGVVRRNTGYALDELVSSPVFKGDKARHKGFNFSRLIAGSEGTLGIVTEAKLHLDPLPPPEKVLVPVHLDSVMDAIKGNLIALKHRPFAVELMDKTILDLTSDNIAQRKNRFFLKGDPGAVLIVEFLSDNMDDIRSRALNMEIEFKKSGLGFHFPLITGEDIQKVWSLRKAGLGVLSNMKGDAKPVSVIEDTSVLPSMLENYIQDFNKILEKYNLDCVYHAHISVGELHLRPIMNLKDAEHVELFHTIAEETARLVKKYRGSLSGEHGDGRLRGEFIPLMVGERNYRLMREIKDTWDKDRVFNGGKIIDSPPMNTFLRHEPGVRTAHPETIFDFTREGGIIRHIEQCNGSGDCRKTEKTGGTMCPSYMATREERTTTRARANILREFLKEKGTRGPYDHREVYDVLDLCLSCKACKSECPSSVDMAKLKAEFLQHWYDMHGIPIRTWMIGNITSLNRVGSLFPSLFNLFMNGGAVPKIIRRALGFTDQRKMPELQKTTVHQWAKRNLKQMNDQLPATAREVTYFVDEFTNYTDPHIGIATLQLLNKLGIRVYIYKSAQSGRSYFSKGLLKVARKHARENVKLFRDVVNEDRPLIGTEPSAILSFRDEYPEIVGTYLKNDAQKLAENVFMIEEYIVSLFEIQAIGPDLFTREIAVIKLHGHCQQKAVASTSDTLKMLSIPENYMVTEIPSGCCGMAGSFGYEKEHYDLSMKVGELVLFPEVRNSPPDTIIAIPGTSCRHQVLDGTGRAGKHPVEILYNALNI